ncbi:MAG TPA: type I-E CRISPR-associated protein Cse1/CasA [Anaerolineaceae bacterium]|nr:type I-E CRISPR-associated protein Cse1/CasA [Anaerolineaceae bacterium]
MTYSFNLVEQPWIPCRTLEGQIQELSLREVFKQANRLQAVSGDTPLETAAIYRLLLAILHSVLRGPTDAREWRTLWQSRNLDASGIQEYLERWKSRFDLFDPVRPFYQAGDKRAHPKSIISLVMEMASGNNASLFDHHIEEVGAMLSAAKSARVLITAQTFGLAGLSGMEQKFTDCPWTRGIIFFINGDTLFDLLVLNLATAIVQQRIPITGEDQPAWESDDPYLPDRNVPFGYLDYLTWQNRRLLLIPEGDEDSPIVRQFTVAPALRLSADVLDPMKHYRVDEKAGNLVLRFNEERALWRDSAALFRLHNPTTARPPENFYAVASLATDYGYLPSSSVLRFQALGMANDQAKIEFFRQEQLPLPLAYLQDDELIGSLTNCLAQAEQAYSGLGMAGKTLALAAISPKDMDKSWKDISRNTKDQAANLFRHWGADRLYWGALDIPFLQLLADLPASTEAAIGRWQNEVRQAAWDALDYAIAQMGEAPLVYKSTVNARSILGGKLREIFPENQKEVIA